MTSTASTALNPGSTTLPTSSSTPSDSFQVRILVKHATTTKSSNATLISNGDHIEVIPLRVVATIAQLHNDIMAACNDTFQGMGRNGQSLMIPDEKGNMGRGKLATRIETFTVMWEADAKGRVCFTYAHEGNVASLLSLLRERRGCNDVVVVEVDV